jgi:FkbM family methyltransferase
MSVMTHDTRDLCFDRESEYDGRATEADVYNCFRLVLGRLPKREEWTGHSLAAGQPLEAVVRAFVNSLEFTNRRLLKPRDADDLRRVDLDGFSLYVSESDLAVGAEILRSHTYEPTVTAEFRRLLRPGMTVIDIGANIGYYSLLAASLVGPGGWCLAIEPNPRNVRLLAANIALNRYQHVQICQAAATESLTLLFLNTNHSNGVVSTADGLLAEALSRETVLGLRLDDVFPALERVDLIKVDIEGAEYRAITGLLRTIDRHRPAVISEFSPPSLPAISGVSASAYLDLFVQRGYSITAITRDANVPCGADVAKVLDVFDAAGTDHIDLCMAPGGREQNGR